MTTPGGAEHNVTYRAVADFVNLSIEARKARQELKGLKDDTIKFNKEIADSDKQNALDKLRAINEEKNAQRALVDAERQAYKEREDREKKSDQFLKEFARRSQQFRQQQVQQEKDANRFLEDFSRRRVQAVKEQEAAEIRRARAENAANRETDKFYDTLTRRSREFKRAGGGSIGFDLKDLVRDSREAEEHVSRLGRSIRDVSSSQGGGGGGGILGFFDRLVARGDRVGGMLLRIIPSFRQVIAVIALVGAIAGPAVAALGALGGAAIGLVSSLGSLLGVLGALPGFLAAAVTGLGALAVSFTPLLGALKAYLNVQKASGQAAADNGEQQRTAARQVRDASRQVADAEYSLARAHEAVGETQRDLNVARRDALEDLKDLREEVAKGSLDEEGAVLALARAQENYRKALADPTSSLLDRQQALLDVKNAEWDLKDVQDRNIENVQKLAEEEVKGIESSDKVIAAKKAMRDADRGVQQAEQNLQRAIESLADAQHKATQPASALATAQKALDEALSHLSPSARRVFDAFVGMKEQLKEISKSTQEAFFSPIVGQLDNLKSLLPVVNMFLGDAAGAIGRVAAKGIEMISSGPWKADFERISKTNVLLLEDMGDAGLSVAEALKDITISAEPLTKWISGTIKEIAANFRDWIKAGRESGELTEFFEDVRDRLELVGNILWNVIKTLLNFGKAALPFGDDMLKAFKKITEGWVEFSERQAQDGSKFRKWLEDIKPLLKAMGGFVKAIADGLVRFAIDPKNIQMAADIFNTLATVTIPKLFDFFDRLSKMNIGKVLLDAFNWLVESIDQFIQAGGAEYIITFFKTIAGLLKLIVDLGVAKVFGAIAFALGGLAAVAVLGKFTGLFKLFRGFRWLMKNSGGISKAFAGLFTGGGSFGSRSKNLGSSITDRGATYTSQLVTIIRLLERILLAIRGGAVANAADGGTGVVPVGGPNAPKKPGLASRIGSKFRGGGVKGGLIGTAALIGGSLALDELDIGTEEGSTAKSVRGLGENLAGGALTGALIGSIIPGIGTAIGAVVGAAIGGILSIATDPKLREDIGKLGESIGSFFGTVGSWVHDNILKPIGQFFAMIGRAVADAFNWVIELPGNIINWAAGLLNDLGQLLIDAHNWVINLPSRIIEWASGLARDFFSWAGGVGAAIISIPQKVYDWALNILRDIGRGVGNIARQVGDVLYNTFVQPIVTAFEGAWGGIKWLWNHTVGYIPGVPHLAKGGALPEGMAVVGERGAELTYKRGDKVEVIPLNGKPIPPELPGFANGTDFGASLSRSLPSRATTVPSNSVTNTSNSSSNDIVIEKIEINNPVPEKSGDSLFRTIQKVRFFSGSGGTQ